MAFLFDPIGFVADVIAISNALGFNTPFQEGLKRQLCKTEEQSRQLRTYVKNSLSELKNMLAIQVVIGIQARVKTELPSERLETLIKLLFYLKAKAANVVFGVLVKYRSSSKEAVVGFAAASADRIEDVVEKVDCFNRKSKAISAPKSTYVLSRIRGKYDPEIEEFSYATLLNILTMVCSISGEVELISAHTSSLRALETERTTLLLEAEKDVLERLDWDEKRTVFLVGKTRSGKSTVGNALTKRDSFTPSESTTGTMRVEGCERLDVEGDIRYVTEVYDTPGLFDRDDLDVLYKADIEDHIRALQRASTVIMTINVEKGIDSAVWSSLQVYREMFGSTMFTMLVVVLTINEAGSTEILNDIVDFHWADITGASRDIVRENVFAVSLKDLRELNESRSHEVVEYIAKLSRQNPMQPLGAFVNHFNAIRTAINSKAGSVSEYYQELLNTGWNTYEKLTKQYEGSARVCMKSRGAGAFNGFIMKGGASASVGGNTFTKWIRSGKTVLTVKTSCPRSQEAWSEFALQYKEKRNRSDLMWKLGDRLYRNGFGVIVRRGVCHQHFGYSIERHEVFIFQPSEKAQQKVNRALYDLTNECAEELSQGAIAEIANEALPIALHFRQKVRRERSYRVPRRREQEAAC